jgi:hypothetical protein
MTSLERSYCLHLQRKTFQEVFEFEGTLILLKGSIYVTFYISTELGSSVSPLCGPQISARNALNTFPIRKSYAEFKTSSYSVPASNVAPTQAVFFSEELGCSASPLYGPQISARNVLNIFPIWTSYAKFRTSSCSVPASNAASIQTAFTDIMLPFLTVCRKIS